MTRLNKIQGPQPWQEARWAYQSPLGPIILLGHDDCLTDLYFAGEAHQPQGIEELPQVKLPVFQVAMDWLDAYFQGQPMDGLPKPRYELHGTDFQEAVWKYIETIPYGQTLTYGDIAKGVARDLGKAKMSAQAVGGATGRNPISLIVPCHRVMGAKEAITGYGGGLDRKAYLLELEHISYRGLDKVSHKNTM